MIECRLVAYETWPTTPTDVRKSGQFRVDYITLLDELDNELHRIDATDVVLRVHTPSSRIREARRSGDGWPKQTFRPNSPGIILNCESSGGPLEFLADTYTSWSDNLRAISLTLESLRAIDRHGATRKKQQYKGFFPEIAAPTSEAEADFEERAARAIADLVGTMSAATILSGRDAFGMAFRNASALIHSRFGPDSDQMRDLNQHAEVLKRKYRS